MPTSTPKPLIVQNDGSILLDLHTADAELARAAIAAFAELVSSPEHVHTYRINNLTLWNAAAAGLELESISANLEQWSRYPLPQALRFHITEAMGRFGALVLELGSTDSEYYLRVVDHEILDEIDGRRELRGLITPHPSLPWVFTLAAIDRGTLKQVLMRIGYPVKDQIPLRPGAPYPLQLRQTALSGSPFTLRPYQVDASRIFVGGGLAGNGYGVVVLPCGAGKTVVAMAVMATLQYETLIVCPNVSAARQWIREIKDKTDINPEDIGEYSGEHKEIKAITVATYQVLTWRNEQKGEFPHFALFGLRNWGLIVYDEVHLLPAPVFRMTAEIQSKHRLGLTATLVREDGLEGDVFSLVGPKRFDIPWKDMEAAGWIARAVCTEYRISLKSENRRNYIAAKPREQARIAAVNSAKISCVLALVHKHAGEQILVIGQYIDQLEECSQALNAPFIHGSMNNSAREELYQAFREGRIHVLVVSKVANFAIDLPDASVAIQISGTFGSRQEEAQRLGRIMRPKERQAHFYTLVSRLTVEEEYSQNRQRFLGEQGYSYHMDLWETENIL